MDTMTVNSFHLFSTSILATAGNRVPYGAIQLTNIDMAQHWLDTLKIIFIGGTIQYVVSSSMFIDLFMKGERIRLVFVVCGFDSDVRQLTLRFPQSPVPANETTYTCFGFTLPNDTDYHVIATTPIVNNSQVLHHMLLYVCKELPNDSKLSQYIWLKLELLTIMWVKLYVCSLPCLLFEFN